MLNNSNTPYSDESVVAICKVLRVDDEMGGNRIKVRIDPYDANCATDDDLPYCFPLMPKLIHVYPKVGECVLVIWQNPKEKTGQRTYIGPVIAQDYGLDYSPYTHMAKSLLDGRPLYPAMKNPRRNPENDGSLPDREDIAIRGRSNADIILKPNELRLRCGFLKNGGGGDEETKLNFNDKDLAYIQMRYGKNFKDSQNRDFASLVNIVADRINLLSHDSRTSFRLGDRKDLVDDDTLKDVMKNAHPLPYGDDLVYWLRKLVEVFKSHTHPYVMLPPAFNEADKEVLNTDLSDYLSEAVRIN